MAELDLITTQGYAVDDEKGREGVVSFGTCAFDRSGKSVGVIRFTITMHADIAAHAIENLSLLIKHADQISAELGGRPDVDVGQN